MTLFGTNRQQLERKLRTGPMCSGLGPIAGAPGAGGRPVAFRSDARAAPPLRLDGARPVAAGVLVVASLTCLALPRPRRIAAGSAAVAPAPAA